jgi:hypothetical protein
VLLAIEICSVPVVLVYADGGVVEFAIYVANRNLKLKLEPCRMLPLLSRDQCLYSGTMAICIVQLLYESRMTCI